MAFCKAAQYMIVSATFKSELNFYSSLDLFTISITCHLITIFDKKSPLPWKNFTAIMKAFLSVI